MGMGKVSGKICRLKKDEVKRYDFAKKVKRPRALRPLTYFISKIFLKGRVRTYDFQKMEGLKPPYLILANHSSMLDFALAVDAMWPVSMTYVAALDSIFDFTEFLMRRVGIIAKRKFIKDLTHNLMDIFRLQLFTVHRDNPHLVFFSQFFCQCLRLIRIRLLTV